MELVAANENINNNNTLHPAPGGVSEEAGGAYDEIPEDRVLANLTLTVQLDLNQNHPMFKDPVTENQPMLNHILNSSNQFQQKLQGLVNSVVPAEMLGERRPTTGHRGSETTSGTLKTTSKSTSNTTTLTTTTAGPTDSTVDSSSYSYPGEITQKPYYINQKDSVPSTNTPIRVIGGPKGQKSSQSTRTETTESTVQPINNKWNRKLDDSGIDVQSQRLNASTNNQSNYDQSQSLDLDSSAEVQQAPDHRLRCKTQLNEEFEADLRLNYLVTGVYNPELSKSEKVKRHYKTFTTKHQVKKTNGETESFVLQIERELNDNTDNTEVYIKALEAHKLPHNKLDVKHLFQLEVDCSNKSRVSDLLFPLNGYMVTFNACRNTN